MDASGKQLRHITRRYQGSHLIEQSDPAQTTRYQYDATGQASRTQVELKDEQGHVVFSTELATERDPATGEPSQRRLADGSTMRMERGTGGTAKTITVQSRAK